MSSSPLLPKMMKAHGVSRRSFLKYCASLTSLMALPPAMAPRIAHALETAPRPSVIWLSFQECTGCTEAITRSSAPSLEELIFDSISLDYHHTLQAASGYAAEQAREEAMKEHHGKYLVIVDGSIPLDEPGFSAIAGISNLDMLKETAEGAAAIVSVGTCAAYGGLPQANPNPTGAVAVSDIIKDKPIINVPGCPPIPMVMTAVLAHYLTFGIPDLDELGRPKAFFAESIHDRCYRRPFYDKGLFAESFDDAGARAGWCLYKLGCKGPTTKSVCATVKWNDSTSFPIEAGHGCLGCTEPDFWDNGGFYKPLSAPAGEYRRMGQAALVAGVAAGIGGGYLAKKNKAKAQADHETVDAFTLEKEESES
ncbi:hydrogenase small subunit [Tropicimonas marinistellae]|uniref:hydrogenase small subunit n=1 Tax=Tropicimonas marinistellae TaxID=1739787 RepID=UPI00082CA004|nr:hydrogenase small subunit [Tropicimonas marinistellae]